MPHVRSVNLARSTVQRDYVRQPTGFGKLPTSGPVEVRDPGPMRGGLGSGLVGDIIGNHRVHGGSDQAVYAFAREVLDDWERRLGRELADGAFGENLTTVGVDVDDARIGERWRVGPEVELQVTVPRVPCNTFRGWMGERGWLRTFTADGRSGAYLRVISGGLIHGGDEIEVVHRPQHDVTIALAFRAMMDRPDLVPALAAAGDDLPDRLRERVEKDASGSRR